MPVSITGTGIQFPSGTQVSAGKIITFHYTEYGVRQSTPLQSGSSNYDLWTANSFTRKRSNSAIRVKGMLPGSDAYSYPYGGTYVSLTSPGGTVYRSFAGSTYQSNYQGEIHILWYVDYIWPAADISSETGTWTVKYGYGDISGGGGNKPWEQEWNPNSSDDSRAFQTYSTSMVEEIII
jgi:hypothetical protein